MTLWTDLATWRGPTVNKYGGRKGKIRGMCLHIAAGYYEGTINWQKNPAAEISSHFVVSRSGAVAQMVDTADVAWTQSDGNQNWLTVEFEGFPKGHPLHRPGWEALSGFQLEAAAKLFARGAREFGYPLQLAGDPAGYGLGHHSMGGAGWGGHYNCPGVPILAQKGEIVARAQAIAGQAPKPAPAPAPEPAALPYPLQYPPHCFGDIAGPWWCHGGADASERNQCRKIQTRLNGLGFACGQVDGVIGPRTVAAIKAFQRSRGLAADGLIGPATWRRLFS